MRRAVRFWLVFAACNLVVGAALVRISAVVVRLERSELQARAETEYQESLRLALWRMDSWLSLFLARQAARPGGESQPLEPDSEFLLLRFEVDARGAVTSPQGMAGVVGPFLPCLRPEALRAAVLPPPVE